MLKRGYRTKFMLSFQTKDMPRKNYWQSTFYYTRPFVRSSMKNSDTDQTQILFIFSIHNLGITENIYFDIETVKITKMKNDNFTKTCSYMKIIVNITIVYV